METSSIQCQVCLRPAAACLTFICPTCARNALYEPRLQHVQALLNKEVLGREVQQALNTSQRKKEAQRTETGQKKGSARLSYERTTSELSKTTEQNQTVLYHVEALRAEMKQMRADMADRRTLMERRRAALMSTKCELVQEETQALEPVQKASAQSQHRWNALHTRTVESRSFLCREVASLYGLQQKKRRRGVPGRDTYLIGGIPIVDIRDINHATPLQITVSTNYLAHLLHLVSHYLSLRLPAEILLPHALHPYPQILSPLSSYNTPSIPHHPTKSSSFPSSSIPSTQTPLRVRPLHTDKPVLALAAEDPIAYANFIEAITFLAWDIAWLCKTQGLDVTARSWEDVCAMGKNMWLLFSAPPARLPTSRTISATTDATTKTNSTTATTPTKSPHRKLPDPARSEDPPPLGYLSHGTTHSFLAGADGAEYMRNWKLASPLRVIEKVKAALASERMGAEWEVLEEGEWEGEGLERERAAAGAAKPDTVEHALALGGILAPVLGGAASGDAGLAEGTEEEGEGKKERDKGGRGWMKVKSRGAEV